jgi:predicted transposase/invertase (TIGR01784 family)
VLYANLDEKEREMIDYAEMSRADAQGQLEYAWDEGMAQGRAQGISQTAVRMLAMGMAPDTIRDITGLDAEAIRRLGGN